jgi:hypothetical protein
LKNSLRSRWRKQNAPVSMAMAAVFICSSPHAVGARHAGDIADTAVPANQADQSRRVRALCD